MNIFSKIKDYISQLFYKNNWHYITIETIEGITLRPRTLYIESRNEKNRWVYLKCPCGCNDLISVNLMQSVQPSWLLTFNNDKTLTLYPSIDKETGCRSHFFIRNSKIVWALRVN